MKTLRVLGGVSPSVATSWLCDPKQTSSISEPAVSSLGVAGMCTLTLGHSLPFPSSSGGCPAHLLPLHPHGPHSPPASIAGAPPPALVCSQLWSLVLRELPGGEELQLLISVQSPGGFGGNWFNFCLWHLGALFSSVLTVCTSAVGAHATAAQSHCSGDKRFQRLSPAWQI